MQIYLSFSSHRQFSKMRINNPGKLITSMNVRRPGSKNSTKKIHCIEMMVELKTKLRYHIFVVLEFTVLQRIGVEYMASLQLVILSASFDKESFLTK